MSLAIADNFHSVFQRFQELMTLKSGHRFRSFAEGRAAVWEARFTLGLWLCDCHEEEGSIGRVHGLAD
jgi:hypothetical protein